MKATGLDKTFGQDSNSHRGDTGDRQSQAKPATATAAASNICNNSGRDVNYQQLDMIDIGSASGPLQVHCGCSAAPRLPGTAQGFPLYQVVYVLQLTS